MIIILFKEKYPFSCFALHALATEQAFIYCHTRHPTK